LRGEEIFVCSPFGEGGIKSFLRDLCVLCGEMALLRVTVALEKANALK